LGRANIEEASSARMPSPEPGTTEIVSSLILYSR
jgi:hypothetical protein